MSEDSVGEPYIEITYTDENGETAGLIEKSDNINSIVEYAQNYSEVLDAFNDDNVMSIVYDSSTEKMNLVKFKNGNYVGNKFFDDYSDAVFLGYVINRTSSLSKEDKVKKLYEIMKLIMAASYEQDLEQYFIFKVKTLEIENIYDIKNWREGYSSNVNEEESEEFNISTIGSEFSIDLKENSVQKTKSL